MALRRSYCSLERGTVSSEVMRTLAFRAARAFIGRRPMNARAARKASVRMTSELTVPLSKEQYDRLNAIYQRLVAVRRSLEGRNIHHDFEYGGAEAMVVLNDAFEDLESLVLSAD